MEIFVLVWIGCAVLCAMLASKKNRNVGAWLLIAAFIVDPIKTEAETGA